MSGFALSASQRLTLAAICDTICAPLSDGDTERILSNEPPAVDASRRDAVRAFCKRGASSAGVDVPADIERALANHAPADAQREIGLLLSAMGSRLGMLALSFRVQCFADLPLSARESVMRGFMGSIIPAKRKAFVLLKGLIAMKFLSTVDPSSKRNLNWDVVGFGMPDSDVVAHAAAAGGRSEYTFKTLNSSIDGPATWGPGGDARFTFDVIVIGSGCGGAVMAAELASVGLRVLVMEKGKYYQWEERQGTEAQGFDEMYERGGLLSTDDTGMVVMAGATFGGGTAVNWACCLPTPSFVCEEWSREFGLTQFEGKDYQESLETVMTRIGVTKTNVSHNRNNTLMLQGCEALGFHCEVTGQAMADVSPKAPGAGFIGVGDPFAIKRSMQETYLKEAATHPRAPAEFLDRCTVDRVLHKGGRTRGVSCSVVGVDGHIAHRLTVLASTVVVAGGAVNSPALLLRSKIADRSGALGTNLRLHPVVGVCGLMPAEQGDVAAWSGAPMTTVSNVVAAGPDNSNYGAKLECPSVLPGLLASVAPWHGALEWKQHALGLRRMFTMIVLTRDRGSGCVTIGASGEPRLSYKIGTHDQSSMLAGMEAALRVAVANGAEAVFSGQMHLGWQELPSKSQGEESRQQALEEILRRVRAEGVADTFRCPQFAAHQMGTCQMGTSAATSVVSPQGEVWSTKGLYVCDASVFPTSSGANPMITTLAIAHQMAQGLKKTLLAAPSSRL